MLIDYNEILQRVRMSADEKRANTKDFWASTETLSAVFANVVAKEAAEVAIFKLVKDRMGTAFGGLQLRDPIAINILAHEQGGVFDSADIPAEGRSQFINDDGALEGDITNAIRVLDRSINLSRLAFMSLGHFATGGLFGMNKGSIKIEKDYDLQKDDRHTIFSAIAGITEDDILSSTKTIAQAHDEVHHDVRSQVIDQSVRCGFFIPTKL